MFCSWVVKFSRAKNVDFKLSSFDGIGIVVVASSGLDLASSSFILVTR